MLLDNLIAVCYNSNHNNAVKLPNENNNKKNHGMTCKYIQQEWIISIV